MDGIYVAYLLGFCHFISTDFISVRDLGVSETVRSMGLAYCSGWAGALYLSSLAFLVPGQVPSYGPAGNANLSSRATFLVPGQAGNANLECFVGFIIFLTVWSTYSLYLYGMKTVM